MSRRSNIPRNIRKAVNQRANNLCEYCHTSEQWQLIRFTIDHVVPIHLGGDDQLENLALACFHCNRRKSIHTSHTDPDSGEMVSIFNPRQQKWYEHFIWSVDKLKIIGLSRTGRATIELLALNRPRVLKLRAADIQVDRHPPADDPVQEF